MPGRVVAVGLGPAGADLVLPAARAAFARCPVRFVRTARHPAVIALAVEGVTFASFDAEYEAHDDLEGVYDAIVARLIAAAKEYDEVVYAVPGSPTFGERTVVLLRASGVSLEIVPGLSFADLAWTRVGVDPLLGAGVVDARDVAVSGAGLSGPLLFAQCDSRLVLSEVKLRLLDALAPDHPVTVLQRLGLPDEAVFDVPVAELDRTVEPDHLTSLFVDTGGRAVAGEFARLVELAQRLRGPGGCPWDAEQTHHSLRRHVIEEAYEVAEAIEELPFEAPDGAVAPGAYEMLEDELGDLLFQVVIQSVLAAEAGAFTIADVARGIHDKLVRRHPHVFGSVEVESADDVVANWEQIKRDEKGDDSLVAGIGEGLPALIRAQKLFRKASAVGIDPSLGARRALTDAVDALAAAAGPGNVERALGEVLGAAAAVGRALGVDAESALAGWARRFKDRFVAMERLASARGIDLAAAGPDAAAALWSDAGAASP